MLAEEYPQELAGKRTVSNFQTREHSSRHCQKVFEVFFLLREVVSTLTSSHPARQNHLVIQCSIPLKYLTTNLQRMFERCQMEHYGESPEQILAQDQILEPDSNKANTERHKHS